MVDRDVEALATIWGDQLVVTPPGGAPADRDTALGLVEKGVLAYQDVSREVDHVIVAGAVMVSLGRESVVEMGTKERQVRRYTHVWLGRDDDWRLISRHASVEKA